MTSSADAPPWLCRHLTSLMSADSGDSLPPRTSRGDRVRLEDVLVHVSRSARDRPRVPRFVLLLLRPSLLRPALTLTTLRLDSATLVVPAPDSSSLAQASLRRSCLHQLLGVQSAVVLYYSCFLATVVR